MFILSYYIHFFSSYCVKAKELFKSLQVPFKDLDLDLVEDGPEIQNELAALTNQRTVPNIFIKAQHVGGCDKIMQLHSDGKLLSMI